MIQTIREQLSLSRLRLLRLVILGGVGIGLIGIGFIVTRVSPEWVLAATFAPLAILLALDRLEYGVVGIVLTAAFVRFSLPTGTQSRIVASLVMTLIFLTLWPARMLVVEKRVRLKPLKTNRPLLAFIVTAIISYVWGNVFRDPLVMVWRTWPFVQLGGLAVMILLPGAFLLTVNCLSEMRWLKLLTGAMILVGGGALTSAFLGVRLSFLNTGGLFSLWFVSLTYAQALFNRRFPLWLRVTLLGVAGAWIYVYFIRRVTWLSGWLPPLVAVGIISLLKSRKLFLIFLLLVALYVGLNWEYYTGTVFEAESQESGYTRLDAWKHNWRVTGRHLLFGTGPAGYAAYYMSYFPTEAMATHNNYIDIISQTGIVGLFFCLWFFGALGWTGYRLFQYLKGAGNFDEGFAAAMLAGWAGCVLAMGLGDWMFPFVYTQTIAGFDYAVYSWVLLGGIGVLSDIARRGMDGRSLDRHRQLEHS